MLFYIITILVSMAIIIVANVFSVPFDASNLLWVSVNVVIGTVGVIALDGVGATVVRKLLPRKWFMPTHKIWDVPKWEHNFYKAIKIKSWKDRVPELGASTTGFSKSHLKTTSDKAYLEEFLVEINYGYVVHWQNALCGFAIMFIPYWFNLTGIIFPCPPSIWIPIFAVNFVLSLLPAFILRYTGYTLSRLYKKQLKKEQQA